MKAHAVLPSALLILLLAHGPATGQEWARKMFNESAHDFGIVAAGTEAVHRFEFQNIYKEDVRVVSVRSSCGCTSATIEKQDLKTYEKSAVVARFNTVAFRDQKQATLTVTLDRPYPAEVQLIVRGNIRGNVVFEPGSVQFGDMLAGSASSRSIRVNHRGMPNWQITDVKTTFDDSKIKVRLRELNRSTGSASYEMEVELLDNLDPGYVSGELFIETNEGLRYPLLFAGRVTKPLEIGPEVLTLGPLVPGQVVNRRVLLKAEEPFRVTKIESSDQCLALQCGNQPGKLQILDVTFTAGPATGCQECLVKISTDLGAQMQAQFRTLAIVESPPASAPELAPQPGTPPTSGR